MFERLKRLNTTKTTAGLPGHATPAQLELLQAGRGDRNIQHIALPSIDDFTIVDITGLTDNALAIGKPISQINEIGGRGEHNDMIDAVILQGHRDLIGQGILMRQAVIGSTLVGLYGLPTSRCFELCLSGGGELIRHKAIFLRWAPESCPHQRAAAVAVAHQMPASAPATR